MPLIFLCQDYEDDSYHIRSSTVKDKHKFQITYPKLIIKNIYNINKAISVKPIIELLGRCGHGNSSKIKEKNFDIIDSAIKLVISNSGALDLNSNDESMELGIDNNINYYNDYNDYNDYNISDEDILIDA